MIRKMGIFRKQLRTVFENDFLAYWSSPRLTSRSSFGRQEKTFENHFHLLRISISMVLLIALAAPGCGSQKTPPSPEGQAFKKEVTGIIGKMQESLAPLMAKGDIAAINAVLEKLSQKTAYLCVDCPYKMAVINKEGTILTTYPNNEFIGRNFSTYRIVLEPLNKKKITQSQAFLGNGSKIYFISAPLLDNGKVNGIVVLALTPQDLKLKWHLEEEEFLKLDLNSH